MVIKEDYSIVTDVCLEELGNFLWYWVDFNCPTERETQFLASHFRFHPLAIEDCILFLQRPKLDYYDGYNFFVLQGLNSKTLHAQEIDVFLSNDYIVTFHKQPSVEMDKAWETTKSEKIKEKLSPEIVFHLLIDKIVDQYFPTVYQIEDQLDKIEKMESRQIKGLMNKVFDIRGDLLRLRRIIFPMRDLLYRVMNSERIEIPADRKAYFGDIYDHLLKLAEIIESNRDVTSDIRDSYISINSHRMNNIMMTLTVISSIFIPLTFIVGVYGMNFVYIPELKWHYGYFMVLVFMALIALGMLWWFKKKGWIGNER
jgi:magnesium transporter